MQIRLKIGNWFCIEKRRYITIKLLHCNKDWRVMGTHKSFRDGHPQTKHCWTLGGVIPIRIRIMDSGPLRSCKEVNFTTVNSELCLASPNNLLNCNGPTNHLRDRMLCPTNFQDISGAHHHPIPNLQALKISGMLPTKVDHHNTFQLIRSLHKWRLLDRPPGHSWRELQNQDY